MGFEEAIEHLDALGVDAMKKSAPSLHRIEALCEVLDHPERAVPAIHITGTNGKTSTARIASSLLTATGLTVGAYTSPHLQSVRERIALDGEAITEDQFGDVFDHVLPYLQKVEQDLGEPATYFEVLTAMYFLWAAEAPVDASVIEVGLGGTWDATNVVPAPVAVITNVSLDHTSLMGDDRSGIAREKAGIVKDDAAVITAERDSGILDIIREASTRHSASLSILDRNFSVLDNRVALGGRYLSVKTSARLYEGTFVPLHGSHQGLNAATALEAVGHFLPARELEQAVVDEGFANASVPGRLETVKGDADATVVLDVAHNPDGMSAAVSSLLETFAFERVSFVVGFLADKDHDGMLRELARVPCRLFLTRPRSGRALSAEELRSAADALGLEHDFYPTVDDAVDAAIGQATDSEIVCVTGSHYVVGEARTHLRSF